MVAVVAASAPPAQWGTQVMNEPWYKAVFGPLVKSRKAMTALIGAVTSIVVTIGAKVGLDLDTATIVILVTPIITGTVSFIFGTAVEDAASKAAGQ